MNLIEHLNWRYAAKRMNGTEVPREKIEKILEAIRLAPTSYGLQPFKVIVVSDPLLREKIYNEACKQPQVVEGSHLLVFAAVRDIQNEHIDNYVDLIAETRDMNVESLNAFKEMIGGLASDTEEHNFVWTARQAYIAFGVGLVAAAMEKVDSTPIEGFDHEKMDKILKLNEQNLSAVNLIALGYRNEELDYYLKLRKVRKSKELLFDFR
ncbi:MAG TPA: NAD(P)H-dependent oxidoreductase [Paludibacter sp.]|nr:NAD(P)H-dependent oxidoreductase [Paludibacter sp.]